MMIVVMHAVVMHALDSSSLLSWCKLGIPHRRRDGLRFLPHRPAVDGKALIGSLAPCRRSAAL